MSFKHLSDNLTSTLPAKSFTTPSNPFCHLLTPSRCPEDKEVGAHLFPDADKSPLGDSSHKTPPAPLVLAPRGPRHSACLHNIVIVARTAAAASSCASASVRLGESHQTLGLGWNLAFELNA